MENRKVYACYNTDTDVRMGSSSGAVFSLLAEHVILRHGIVYGAAMSEDCYSAEFIGVTEREELYRLRGSKYLQARIGGIYKAVRMELESGRLVLFTGTGCQVNGLRGFLGRDYENLICVDVVCHGVPSPKLWRVYVEYLEEKNGGKLRKVDFRSKDDSWIDFGMQMEFCNSSGQPGKVQYIPKYKDAYMQMFLKNYCLRPSCYECAAKKIKRSDLTIADFWGIRDIAPDLYDGKGTSLVLVRTDKGQNIFEEIRSCMKVKEVSYEVGVRKNSAEYESCMRPAERETFFYDMDHMEFELLKRKYTVSESTIRKIRMRKMIKKMIGVFNGGR